MGVLCEVKMNALYGDHFQLSVHCLPVTYKLTRLSDFHDIRHRRSSRKVVDRA